MTSSILGTACPRCQCTIVADGPYWVVCDNCGWARVSPLIDAYAYTAASGVSPRDADAVTAALEGGASSVATDTVSVLARDYYDRPDRHPFEITFGR